MSELSAVLNEALAGRYVLGREIGTGGMATVFLARDLRHDRDVAFKVLDPELVATIGTERFLAEIRTTARLQHPHILPLFDSGEAEGFLFYVMPFVDGETLKDRLAREGQLPMEDALRIAREVADGLAYAHAAGVVHRDIKPANILLGNSHATLADFGIARSVARAGADRLTRTGTAVGTPTYMSPEQASGDMGVDGRSDIYSLGCVLYEMLAGEPPFSGPTAASIVAKKLTQGPPSVRVVRDGAPASVEEALTRALARSPADRFATAELFAAALVAPASVTLREPLPPATPTPLWRRTRTWLSAAVAAVLLTVGARILLRGTGGAAGVVAGDTGAIAVLPFAVRGVDELTYLSEGLVDLLSTKLDGVGGMRATDPQAVLAALPRGGADALSAEEVARIAERLGAGRLIRGTVLNASGQILIQARVLESTGADAGIDASIEGPADDLFALVDGLVSQLVAAGVTGDDARLSDLGELTTRSNAALRLYLDGIRNFREGRGVPETTDLLRRAVALDSTFALAAYWAGYTATFNDLPALADFQLATRHRDHLGARAQMRLAAALAGAEGRHAEAIGLGRHLVDRYPDDVAAWFQLGEEISHSGHFVGDSAGAARPAYERAVRLDPALAPAYFHLAVIGGLQADTTALDAWALELDSAGVDPIWPAILRITRSGVAGDTALMDRSVDTFLSEERLYPPSTLAGSIAELSASVMASDASAARRIVERYARGTGSDTARAVVTRRRARMESALGRFERAEQMLRSIGGDHRTLLPYDLAAVALHPAADGGERARAAERLLMARTPPTGSREAGVRRYLLARLALELGQPERFIEELGALRQEADAGSGTDGPSRDLVLELAALDARLRGEPARGLDSLLASRYWTREEAWPEPGADTYFQGPLADRWPHFLRAELLREAGRDADAALWYRVAADGVWHRAIGMERLTKLAATAGDTARTTLLLRQLEQMWSGADPEVVLLVDVLRARVQSPTR